MSTIKPTRCDHRRAGRSREAWRLCADEKGIATIFALFILTTVLILGMIALRSSQTEIQIAGSERMHKNAFYAADGATELSAELLEQNIEAVGFPDFTIFGGLVEVENGDFWLNGVNGATTPSDANRDFYLPAGAGPNQARTNVTVGGRSAHVPGGAIQMAAGYEGKGKAAGQGGTMNLYDITVQHVGMRNSEAIVRVQWRHVN
jgi:hypothetical protein